MAIVGGIKKISLYSPTLVRLAVNQAQQRADDLRHQSAWSTAAGRNEGGGGAEGGGHFEDDGNTVRPERQQRQACPLSGYNVRCCLVISSVQPHPPLSATQTQYTTERIGKYVLTGTGAAQWCEGQRMLF